MSELFEAFGVTWSLLIAQAVNFAIVLVALWYFLYKPVLAMLSKRKEMIVKGVQDAERASEMLATADAEVANRLNVADKRAEEALSRAREIATSEKARLLKEAEARAVSVVRDAEARAVSEAEKMRRESEREIARLAILAAEKIVKERI